MIRRLNLKNYRKYVQPIQEQLGISDTKEMEIFEFIEDVYNSVEDDIKASAKCITMMENSTRFSLQEKIFAGCMIILQDLKSQQLREDVANRKFKNKFTEEDDDDLEEEIDED